MKVEIDFPKRLYEEIVLLCEENGMKFADYVVETVSNSYYTLKYGDLNIKMGLVEEEKQLPPKVEEEKPKKTRTRKKAEVKEEPRVEEKKEVETEQTVVKRRRTLKAK